MKAKNGFLFSAILASAAALGLTATAFAQSDSGKSAKQGKLVAKPHKVWTNDEVGTLRSPGDAYVEAKEKQTEKTPAPSQTASEKQPAANAAKTSGAPALSNPKTVDDADRMIAWENRDVEAQEEYVERLKKEIDEAPADQKERLAKMLQERQQILEDTRKERDELQAEKAKLQKKPAAQAIAAAAQPPSQ